MGDFFLGMVSVPLLRPFNSIRNPFFPPLDSRIAFAIPRSAVRNCYNVQPGLTPASEAAYGAFEPEWLGSISLDSGSVDTTILPYCACDKAALYPRGGMGDRFGVKSLLLAADQSGNEAKYLVFLGANQVGAIAITGVDISLRRFAAITFPSNYNGSRPAQLDPAGGAVEFRIALDNGKQVFWSAPTVVSPQSLWIPDQQNSRFVTLDLRVDMPPAVAAIVGSNFGYMYIAVKTVVPADPSGLVQTVLPLRAMSFVIDEAVSATYRTADTDAVPEADRPAEEVLNSMAVRAAIGLGAALFVTVLLLCVAVALLFRARSIGALGGTRSAPSRSARSSNMFAARQIDKRRQTSRPSSSSVHRAPSRTAVHLYQITDGRAAEDN